MRAFWQSLQGAHDSVALYHASSIVLAVLDAIWRIGEHKVVFAKWHIFETLRIIDICWIQRGVYVYRIAGKNAQIDLAAKEVKNPLFVWEKRFDTLQISSGIAAIIFRLHAIVIAHDPCANDPAVSGSKEALRESRLGDVIVYSMIPLHSLLRSQSASNI